MAPPSGIPSSIPDGICSVISSAYYINQYTIKIGSTNKWLAISAPLTAKSSTYCYALAYLITVSLSQTVIRTLGLRASSLSSIVPLLVLSLTRTRILLDACKVCQTTRSVGQSPEGKLPYWLEVCRYSVNREEYSRWFQVTVVRLNAKN